MVEFRNEARSPGKYFLSRFLISGHDLRTQKESSVVARRGRSVSVEIK